MLQIIVTTYKKGVSYYIFLFPDLVRLVPSTLDAKLVPEHLLRLCLEHERNFVSSHKSACAHNFYKVFKDMVLLV